MKINDVIYEGMKKATLSNREKKCFNEFSTYLFFSESWWKFIETEFSQKQFQWFGKEFVSQNKLVHQHKKAFSLTQNGFKQQ